METNLSERNYQISDVSFIKILIAIIAGWVLVQLWIIATKAFAFEYLGLSKNSWVHTLFVAIIATILFIVYVNCIGKDKIIVQSQITGMNIGPYSAVSSIIS